jgi:hypothetical protein
MYRQILAPACSIIYLYDFNVVQKYSLSGSKAVKSPGVIWCIQSRSYGIVVVVVIVVAMTTGKPVAVKEEVI